MNHYLIQFGRSAFVGRFTFVDQSLARGASVIIRTVRGEEIGFVLCPAIERFASSSEFSGGVVLRIVGPDDRIAIARADQLAAKVMAAAEQQAGELPVTFADAEATLNGVVVLHVIPFAECDLRPLLDALSSEFQTVVTLQDLSRPTAVPDAPDAVEAGCGKPNCGSESGGGGCSTGGGCTTGSCSKGKIKSAEELTEYFADLRQKMESDAAGRVALH